MGEKKRRAHVLAWQNSALSKAEYCRREDLVYGTFCGWCREFEGSRDGFVLLDQTQNTEGTPVLVRLPNGIELVFDRGLDQRTLKLLMDV